VNIIGEAALAEYWDGSTWVRQLTPTPVNRPDDALYDVSCNGGSLYVAVGESHRVHPTNGHLIDGRVMGVTWNGTAWSQTPPVVPSGLNASLDGISCPLPTACMAVGNASHHRVHPRWSRHSRAELLPIMDRRSGNDDQLVVFVVGLVVVLSGALTRTISNRDNL
jgi:hypothetical protein